MNEKCVLRRLSGEIVPSVGAAALLWTAAKRSGIFGPMKKAP